ncbi:MAG: serine protease [Desulfobacteraceae bacterium]|jgi:secreted trypsin-like serine protease|nr:serine protease [Desulfobacteraceae bacterium]
MGQRISNRDIISVFFITFIFFASANVYATDDLIWAIPKPDPLESDQAPTASAELKPLPESLSASKPFIVGGSSTPLGKYPEYALLWVDGLDGNFYAICGGSLITSDKVLTAAHCTVDFTTSRLAAIPQFHSFSEDATYDNLISVTQKIEHPDYDKQTGRNNDIAILTLGEPTTTARAKIYGGTNQFVEYTATVIGTGRLSDNGDTPNILQEVNLPIVSNTKCASVWGASSITPAMVCAGGTSSGGIGACSGDSGGPLFVVLDGERVQAGIVSWGPNDCAIPNYYDVYARTSTLIGFVRQYAPGAAIVLDKENLVPILDLMLLGPD